MSEQICPYCKGTKIGTECDKYGTPTGKIGECYSCGGKGKSYFRFDTIDESIEWQKNHPDRSGLYRENVVWLGEVYESLVLYLESHETGIPCQDLYDIKYGILRFEI